MYPPFARVGANATCASCGHRFRIGRDELRHEWPESVARSHQESEAPDSGEAGREREAQTDPETPDEEGETIDWAAAEASETATAPRLRLRRRRRGGPLIALAVGLTLVLGGVVGGGAWWVTKHGPVALNGGGADGGDESRDDGEKSAPGSDLPSLQLERLASPSWQRVDRPLPSAPDHGPLSVLDVRWGYAVRARAGAYFDGKLISAAKSPLVDVRLRFFLHRPGGKVAYAVAAARLAAVVPGVTHPVGLPVPEGIYESDTQARWELVARTAWPDGLVLARPRAQPLGDGSRVRVSARNPGEKALEDVLMALTGLSARGRVVGRWRATWTRRVGPGDGLAAVAEPRSEREVSEWRLIAVGRPASPDAAAKRSGP